MKFQKLGKSGIEVSRFCYGAWGVGGGNVWSDMQFDSSDVEKLLDAASDLGVNYIDTAPVYGVGASEIVLGQALKNGGRRDKFILQTKCSLNWRGEGKGEFEYERDGKTVCRDLTKDSIIKDVEDSLERLQTDHIDVLVVHRARSIKIDTPVAETADALNTLKQQGKIRAAGISNSSAEDLKEYLKYTDIALVQEKYSVVNSKNLTAYVPTCNELGVIFQPYGNLEEGAVCGPAYYEKELAPTDIRSFSPLRKEPLRSMMLQAFKDLEPMCAKHNCSVTNLFQAYMIDKIPNVSLLTGFRRIETLTNSMEALDVVLDADEIAVIDAFSKNINAKMAEVMAAAKK